MMFFPNGHSLVRMTARGWGGRNDHLSGFFKEPLLLMIW